MKSDLVNELIKNAGIGHIAENLSEMPSTELHTLLMGVSNQRAQKLDPTTIAAQYKKSGLVTPCPIDQRLLIETDIIAYRVLDPRFRGIELSPVMPLGTNKILGNVSQKNVLGTIRSTEVVADPTTALALECAKERHLLLKKDSKTTECINLATSVRNLRLQNFKESSSLIQHFRAFALTTAGRDVGHRKFECESLGTHIAFYLRFIKALSAHGDKYHAENITVSLSDVRIMRLILNAHGINQQEISSSARASGFSVFQQQGFDLPTRVNATGEIPESMIRQYGLVRPVEFLSVVWEQAIAPLQDEFPDVSFEIHLDRSAGMSYYTHSCFKIRAESIKGIRYSLVDGGMVDWTQKILSSNKERLLTSGMGTELFCANFQV